MTSFFDATRDAVKTGLCNYLTFADKGRSWVNELSPVDLPNFGEFWNRTLCDRDAPLPSSPPQFTGGQCPGVEYDVFFTFDYRGTQGPNCTLSTGSRTRRGLGPVQGVFVTAGDSPNPDRYNSVVTTKFADGDQVGPATFTEFECDGYAITGVTVTRVDGQPDNCGNPPPVVPPFPSGGDTINIDVTYVNNDGDTVTELGDFNLFAPIVIAPVTIVAPIRVNLPDVNFNGTIVLSPEFGVELQPPSFRRGPGDTDDPPPDEDPTTSPVTPDDDSDRRLIGAITTVTAGIANGKATQLDGDSGPDLFVPRMGTLSFRVRTAASLAWSQPLDIKTTTQFHPAPENVQSLDAVATPNPGYTIAVTLVYSDSQT